MALDLRLHSSEVIANALKTNPSVTRLQIVDERLSSDQWVTMLWQACAIGLEQLVDPLIAHGSDVNYCRQSDGVSCLYIASQNGHANICSSLLRAQANVDIRRNTRATPLFIATQRNHVNVVRTLLEHGASGDIANDQQCTPLVLACNMGHSEIAKLLLMSGCDVLNDLTGRTPLSWAKLGKRVETVNLLHTWMVSMILLPKAVKSWTRAYFQQWISALEYRRGRRVASDVTPIAKLPPLHELCAIDFGNTTLSTAATNSVDRWGAQTASTPPTLSRCHDRSPSPQQLDGGIRDTIRCVSRSLGTAAIPSSSPSANSKGLRCQRSAAYELLKGSDEIVPCLKADAELIYSTLRGQNFHFKAK